MSSNIPFHHLDKTIHERARLAIMTTLTTQPRSSFQSLKSALDMTDGNLMSHLNTLSKAGLISSSKSPSHSKSHTTFVLTVKGKEAFNQYRSILKEIVAATDET
ncbi:MAG: transcriptional regulator [Verrucomicrobiota bacterium]